MNNSIEIVAPVRGIWITPNTPGSRVPSHGTSIFGEDYAVDFVMINENDPLRKAYKSSFLKYLLSGLPLNDFYGWGQNIYSPVEGIVIEINNSIVERQKVNVINDYRYTIKVSNELRKGILNPGSIAGNYILVKCSENVYALFAHLKKDSILVQPGQRIKLNQIIGQIGHSGNSMMPHLHLQFIDNSDFTKAHGIPFNIKEYEVKRNEKWEKIYDSIPTDKDVLMFK
jgi:hypothetical protein